MPHIGVSIFSKMSALASEYKAINLSQGFPDFDCHPKLLELVRHYQAGHNQYAPMSGALVLRERIAELIHNCYSAVYNPETEITITAGATQAIYTCLAAFVNSGDEVIVFEPCYDSYLPAIIMNSGIPKPIELETSNFKINWQKVKETISEKTRCIIINTPHNPSGTTLSKEDLVELERLVKGTNIIVLSDEVYEHMIFDGNTHQSVARFKTLANQSFIISSFGKTLHATGWKIGYVAAPKELMLEFRKVHQFLVFCVNHPLQMAVADYLKDQTTYKELSQFYQAKRDYFTKQISGSRFNIEPNMGTYFQLVNYKNISKENDTDFAVRLTKESGLALIPLSVFYTTQKQQQLLRVCFAKKEDTLEQAAEIMCKL